MGLASGMLKRESGFRLCLEASERRCGMCGGGRDTHSGMPTDPDSIVLTQLCAGGKQNLRWNPKREATFDVSKLYSL